MMWEFGAGYGWMLLWMVLFWGGTIFLIVWGVGQLTRTGRKSGSYALEILQERYVRGEIDRDQFESMSQTLIAGHAERKSL